MAGLRRTYVRPCLDARLHIDPRTKRRTVVRAGGGPDIAALSCNIMAGPRCTDHDVADGAQNLLAKEVFRASSFDRRCDAQIFTVDDGYGTGQSPPCCMIAFSDSPYRCAKDS